jgi:hypothetical protein
MPLSPLPVDSGWPLQRSVPLPPALDRRLHIAGDLVRSSSFSSATRLVIVRLVNRCPSNAERRESGNAHHQWRRSI